MTFLNHLRELTSVNTSTEVKVNDTCIAIRVHHEVEGLDVAVNNTAIVHVR